MSPSVPPLSLPLSFPMDHGGQAHPSNTNESTALLLLLAPSLIPPLSRPPELLPLRLHRHKPPPPNPHHPARDRAFPIPSSVFSFPLRFAPVIAPSYMQQHHPHLLHSRPNVPLPRPALQRQQARPLRLRPLPRRARRSSSPDPRHGRCTRCHRYAPVARQSRETAAGGRFEGGRGRVGQRGGSR